MKNNAFSAFILLLASIVIAITFGETISNYLFPGNGWWGVPSEIANFVNSFPFIYYFLSPIIFTLWGEGKKWIWITGSILPLTILDIYIELDIFILLLSAKFFVAGIIIALAINFFRKQRTTK